MKKLIPILLLLSTPTSAFDLKLDDSWISKLTQLCEAARFGSRMHAEPICNELAQLVQKAIEAEKAAQPKEPER